jgi:pyroglutamyl-peptidase
MPSAAPVVLLTGFEPFGGAAANPSWDAVELVAREGVPGATVVAALLPVEFAGALDALRAAVARHSPDAVIAVGLAEGRSAITPERVGINVDDARIPDNGGAQPRDERIEADGPDARFSTLPVRAIADALTAAGLPAAISNTAGTYVCNHVAYALPALVDGPAGFVHVPATPETGIADVPTVPLETIVAALRIAVSETAATL